MLRTALLTAELPSPARLERGGGEVRSHGAGVVPFSGDPRQDQGPAADLPRPRRGGLRRSQPLRRLSATSLMAWGASSGSTCRSCCLLTSCNYALRFVKWQYYLKLIGVQGFPRGHSALSYLAGLGMVVTPGKVGEWLKCYLLRELHGTPFTRSAPILIAERLTDCLAMVLLGSVGLVVYRDSWPVFVIVLVGGVAMFFVARHQPLAYWILHRLEHLPLVSRFARHAEEFYESSYTLMSPFAMMSMTLLSFFSWGFEVLAFYVVLIGMGQDGGADLLLKASFIMPAATLASAVLADAWRPRRGGGRHHGPLHCPARHVEERRCSSHADHSLRHAVVRRPRRPRGACPRKPRARPQARACW